MSERGDPGPPRQECVTLKERTVRPLVVRLLKDQTGATAIEYGLIAAGIAVAIIAGTRGLGTKLTATFKSVSDNLK